MHVFQNPQEEGSKLDQYEERYGHVEGPTDEEAREAYRKLRRVQAMTASSKGQRSVARIIGTPRKAKHRGGRIEGVTLK